MTKKEKIVKVKGRDNRLSWDDCFMKIAHIIADRSQDPSTQAGSVVVNENNVVLGMGYNGWPRGLKVLTYPGSVMAVMKIQNMLTFVIQKRMPFIMPVVRLRVVKFIAPFSHVMNVPRP